MLEVEHSWVWDFWLTCLDSTYHCFFLQAPTELGDPELRHHHARVGHATSVDLRTWTVGRDALTPQPAPAYDDLATWTGCVVRPGSGPWRMFTSGIARGEQGGVQRIGVSTSDDLDRWTREPWVLEADPRWYAGPWSGDAEVHWRDPWVLDDGSGGWRLLTTARSPTTGTAVIGSARSSDCAQWEVGPPLTTPSNRFAWAEVVSVQCVEERWVLVFSCLADHMPGAAPGSGGVWSMPVPPPASWGDGPAFDLDEAVRVTSEWLYVGKVAELPGGGWGLLAFRNRDESGAFVGGVTDPCRLRWREDGRGLELVDAPSEWLPD